MSEPRTPILAPDAENIAVAGKALRDGGLIVFPTETVYGLGADATNGGAIARVFAAKDRPSFNPLIVHVRDTATARDIVAFNDLADQLTEAFWPGALTLVLPRRDDRISLLVSAGLETLAVRAPNHPVAQALLTEAGFPDGFEFNLSGAIAGAGMIEQRAVAAFLQASLGEIGITVNVNLTEFADAYTRMGGGQDDAYLYGITYWMAEPWNQLSLIHQTGQFSNWGRYSNPAADALMSQADSAVGFDERKVIYDEVQEILAEDQAFIYLYHEHFAVVTRSEVQGEVGWTGNYALYLDDVFIAE